MKTIEAALAQLLSVTKTAEGPDNPPTSHPTGGEMPGQMAAVEGARSAENTADSKVDNPANPDDAKPHSSSGDGMTPIEEEAAPTGEDPSVERSHDTGYPDPGTSHPAKAAAAFYGTEAALNKLQAEAGEALSKLAELLDGDDSKLSPAAKKVAEQATKTAADADQAQNQLVQLYGDNAPQAVKIAQEWAADRILEAYYMADLTAGFFKAAVDEAMSGGGDEDEGSPASEDPAASAGGGGEDEAMSDGGDGGMADDLDDDGELSPEDLAILEAAAGGGSGMAGDMSAAMGGGDMSGGMGGAMGGGEMGGEMGGGGEAELMAALQDEAAANGISPEQLQQMLLQQSMGGGEGGEPKMANAKLAEVRKSPKYASMRSKIQTMMREVVARGGK